MYRKAVKSLSFMLVVLTTSIAFAAGCNTKNNEESATPSETGSTGTAAQSTEPAAKAPDKTTLRIVFPGDEPQAQKEVADEIARVSKDQLNIELKFTYIPWDQYFNKINTMISSGEEFDLFWNHVSMLSQFVGKQGLYAMNDAVEKYGADMKKVIPETYWKTASVDGKIYGSPAVWVTADANKILLIRKDLREKYGIPPVTTIADLEKYFDAVKKNEPEMTYIHLGAGTPRFMYRELGNPQLITDGGPLGDNAALMYVDPSDKEMKVKSFYESDIFKTLSGYGKKWKDNGWIPNLVEIKDQVMPFKEGKAASVWGSVGGAALFNKEMKDKVPGAQVEEVFLNPGLPKFINNAAGDLISIPATSTNPERAMMFLNWIYQSQDHYDLMSYGIKDKHFVLKGDRVSLPDGVTPEKNPYNAINWAWQNLNMIRFDASYTDEDIQYIRNWDQGAVESPLLGFKFDPAPVKSELAQLHAIEGEFGSILYTGALDYDKNIAKYVDRLKKAGLEKVIAECQKQIDAFKASKS